jgi:hypothetical protein
MRPDQDGWYYSFFFKRYGPGARKGVGWNFAYVERLTTKRRSKSACKERSINLANGRKATEGIVAKPIAENPPNTGYCMKEKKHVTILAWEQIEAKNGRRMIRASCPDCGTKIQKYGQVIDCPECGLVREAAKDDYLCRVCRES